MNAILSSELSGIGVSGSEAFFVLSALLLLVLLVISPQAGLATERSK